jgi:hypothetical protein
MGTVGHVFATGSGEPGQAQTAVLILSAPEK